MLRFIILIHFLIGSLVLWGCTTREESEAETSAPAKTYLQGDPAQFIFGTNLNNYIADPSVFTSQKLYLTTSVVISQYNEIEKYQKAVSKQTPSTKPVGPEEIIYGKEENLIEYSPYKTMNGKNYFKLGKKTQKEGKYFYYIFEELEDGGVRLVAIDSNKNYLVLNQDYIHLSVSEDKPLVSILHFHNFYTDGDKVLVAEYFTTSREPPKVNTVGNYNYLQGKNVAVNWNQTKPLVVNLCGKDLNEHADWVEESIGHWQKTLENRLDIQLVRKPLGCPPFSDLNTHNIYLIDGVKTAYDHINAGTTYTIRLNELIESDIFLFKHELYKYAKTYSPESYKKQFLRVVAHEFGHMLGLAHQFNPDIKSIMSYESIFELKDYDIEAVQALYPLRDTP
ncbi:MAG: matrixin family metalloprotease [Bdellovibrionales bacterium]|nr:matrixin family metalloprotease [Bdellovibrionales bacterium]